MAPRALVAPDSFKGTFDAPTVARAIAVGLRQAGWEADACPVADGGEGTLALLVEALSGELVEVAAADPLGRRVDCAIGLVENGATAILLSAPVFEVGEGDPYARIEHLRALGPDILPYAGEAAFDTCAFLARLGTPDHAERPIGAALLDQTIVAGIGNYLRAEVLFVCHLDPWRRVADLTDDALSRLCHHLPKLAARPYQAGGAIVPDDVRERMRADRTLVYPNSSGGDWTTRHWVFRRTNLPCLVCGTPICQKRQVTHQTNDGGEKERIIYFCPVRQNTTIDLTPRRAPRSPRPASSDPASV